jgi:hypothetical protein
MSTDLTIGSAVPLEVLRQWDESAETRYALTGEPPELGALGAEYPATAFDPGGVSRDMRVVVLSGLEAGELRGRIHDKLAALGSLRNPNIGAAEATVVVEEGYALVLPHDDGKILDELLEGGPMPARAAAEISLEVAWGLAAAHAAVLPNEIRPKAIPHGAIDATNVSVSGTGEVILRDYNVYAARSLGASTADDVYLLGQLFVHMVEGEPMRPLPADPEAARQALEEDLQNLPGLTDELRSLVTELLDPEPARRPDIRSVARRLRRLIPNQDGLWLSAWAESAIGLPKRERPTLTMPTPTLVAEDPFSDEPQQAQKSRSSAAKPKVDETPPLVRAARKGQGGVQLRFPLPLIGAAILGVAVLLGGGFYLMRFWLDIHGPMDMADTPTNQDGSDKEAMAGPASSSGSEDRKDNPDPSSGPQTTVISAEKSIEAEDEDRSRGKTEVVDSDKAIDLEKAATSPIDDGGDGSRSVPPGAADAVPVAEEVVEIGPPPWPRPAGTLGEFDLFVEVPLAESVRLRCTNGLSMEGPSPFRAAIMQSTPTTCVAEADLRDGRTSSATVELDRTLDLICRYNYHDTLRCSDRPSGRNVAVPKPSEEDLAGRTAHIRVRIPLALSAEVVCPGDNRASGVDIEWLELSKVAIGRCSVEATMPDGAYQGLFVVTKNAEVMCLRDFSGAPDARGRRPLRCGEATAL